MILLERLRREPPDLAPDDPIVRALGRLGREVEPDPLFRRRLRGVVLNRYVAAREGLEPAPRRRRMGRLGRAVLYASVTLAVSATAAGAASQDALPGETLYALKRRIEEVRLRVAPESVRPQLLGMVIEERLSEAQELAGAGEWRLAHHAVVDAVAANDWLEAIGGTPRAVEIEQIGKHLLVLEALIERAPESAQDGLERALDASQPDRSPAGPMQVLPHHGLGSVGGGPESQAGPPDSQETRSPPPQPTHPPHPSHAANSGDEPSVEADGDGEAAGEESDEPEPEAEAEAEEEADSLQDAQLDPETETE